MENKEHCHYHDEDYQELWPDIWMCETCLIQTVERTKFESMEERGIRVLDMNLASVDPNE